ncbi:hypothetical protein CDL15_Pgr009802 [Punica granatum]|nr:hypothetical protein CDL15_Pgr009802 [Punica granatum]PKI77076.1 hypothetical protein CRG98_002579 [Punica granatum]
MATLSRSIGLEYQSFGIDIQCQAPLYISTKMITELGTNILIVPVEAFSKSSVRWMGHNDPICCPFWWHSLQSYITQSFLDDLVIKYLFKTFLRMRREALEEKTGR